MIETLERKHAILVTEFDRYVVDYPEFAVKIPQNAQVVLQIEGDEEYNKWSSEVGRSHAEKGQPIVYVRIKKIRPIRSRIEELEVAV